MSPGYNRILHLHEMHRRSATGSSPCKHLCTKGAAGAETAGGGAGVGAAEAALLPAAQPGRGAADAPQRRAAADLVQRTATGGSSDVQAAAAARALQGGSKASTF